MRHYSDNPKWLLWFAPFRALSVSAAYLTPFFIGNGLRQTDIFLLQSFFSVVVVLWEVPSGWVADRFGRARCIRFSAPLAAITMVGYGLSHSFIAFLFWEFLLAIANGLISGADNALLMDSLKADGKESEFVGLSRQIDGLSFAATAVSVPIAYFVVSTIGVPATLIADGILTSIGMFFAFRLVEAPGFKPKDKSGFRVISREFIADIKAAMRLLTGKETRKTLLLLTGLGASTYFGFWLSAPFYSSIGIPVKYFAILLAVRSALKFWLSHHFRFRAMGRRMLIGYVVLSGMTYIGMGVLNVWLLPIVIGHDVIQSLAFAPLNAKLNESFNDESRATMNSAVNMTRGIAFAGLGPLVGFVVDRQGLSFALLTMGVGFIVVLTPLLITIKREK